MYIKYIIDYKTIIKYVCSIRKTWVLSICCLIDKQLVDTFALEIHKNPKKITGKYGPPFSWEGSIHASLVASSTIWEMHRRPRRGGFLSLIRKTLATHYMGGL